MDALTLLRDDHREIKRLLKELEPTEASDPRRRADLFEQIRRDLTVHEIIEEEIFYPTLKQHPKAREIVLEGYEEHDVVDTLMGELEGLPYDDETWGPKAKVMSENVEHHVDEEEDEMFDKARQVFDDDELEALGRAMAERKAEALQQESAGRLR
ncbi:MAG TPA: hemerythrin domain-containing protein [Candidatus Limnocylindrales bacterium]|nr:hemerythrin domain-containing protein [Candidatus Limnocylindrales bacterium]